MQTQEHLSADEMTRIQAEQREKALKDWKTSIVVAKAEGRVEGLVEGRVEGRVEGLVEGRQIGVLIGKIRVLQQLLKRPISESDELAAVSLADLQTLAQTLEAELK